LWGITGIGHEPTLGGLSGSRKGASGLAKPAGSGQLRSIVSNTAIPGRAVAVPRRVFFLALVGAVAGRAGRAADSGAGLIDLGRKLLEGGVDQGLVESLRSGDSAVLDQLLQQVGLGLQGGSVADLAGLRDTVELALPYLERSRRTAAYVPWLRARLDYFRVAERLVPAPTPGKPAAPAPNPTPARGRQAWERQVAQEAPPRGAATWVPKLKPVFRSAGAPQELVWLAELESSFNPAARSPAGAAGMYQLMPATAQGLGLKLKPTDDRLVPEKGAKAAAAYLRQLRSRFGDWRLALAAYNAGPGRVSEVLKQRRATTFDAIAPSLPAETQMYVPKMEAILQRREGVRLTALGRAGASR
jgi:membrane-bound lytic murein transglycosylase D